MTSDHPGHGVHGSGSPEQHQKVGGYGGAGRYGGAGGFYQGGPGGSGPGVDLTQIYNDIQTLYELINNFVNGPVDLEELKAWIRRVEDRQNKWAGNGLSILDAFNAFLGPSSTYGTSSRFARSDHLHTGTTAVNIANLTTVELETNAVLRPNGVGGVTWGFEYETVVFYIAGTLTTGTTKGGIRIRAPKPYVIEEVRLAVGTAPTGASIIVDVNINGTTIFTTQANRPSIAAAATDGTSITINVTAVAINDILTIDIDQVGSTVAGADLVVQVRCKVDD